MRDSGVEWIGPVPEGWRVAPLKRFADVGNGQAIAEEVSADDEGAIPVYGSGGVFKYTNRVLHSGDSVLFGRKGTLGKPMFVTGDFWTVDTMYYSTFKNNCSPKFVYYMLSAFDWEPYVTRTAVPSMVASEVFALKFAFPDALTQRAIAAYLDAKCGEVDAAVAAARQAIEDYKALKKSLVFEAVTGKRGDVGLGERGEYGEQGGRGEETTDLTDYGDRGNCSVDDFNAKNAKGAKSADGEGRAPARPNDDERGEGRAPARPHDDERGEGRAPARPPLPATAGLARRPMRDSGVAWIGPVPEGWRMSRLRFLCSITTGDHNTQDANPDGQYPFYVRSPNVERSDDYTFEGPGILMAGDGAGAGRVFHLADGKYAVHQRVYRFYDFKEASAKYLWYYLGATFPFVMDKGSAQSTVPSVRLPMLMDHVVVFPDEQEQRAIAEWLDAKCGAIDALVAEQEALVADLERYRKSLIFECVTGKREVCGEGRAPARPNDDGRGEGRAPARPNDERSRGSATLPAGRGEVRSRGEGRAPARPNDGGRGEVRSRGSATLPVKTVRRFVSRRMPRLAKV